MPITDRIDFVTRLNKRLQEKERIQQEHAAQQKKAAQQAAVRSRRPR